jgi:hypothetical protein
VAETFLAVKLSGDDGNEMQERVMILLAIYLPLPNGLRGSLCTMHEDEGRKDVIDVLQKL